MKKLNKEFLERWAKALRSGEYEQGQEHLYHEGAYCCLGVACELIGIRSIEDIEGITLPSDFHYNPVQESFISDDDWETFFSNLNDGYSFSPNHKHSGLQFAYNMCNKYNIGHKDEENVITVSPMTFEQIADVIDKIIEHEFTE